jgi:hypothetical protein
MQKYRELSDLNSCLNRAKADEWVFVLLGRDVAAPHTIRAWAAERIRLGKNSVEDAQIQEALYCAGAMEILQAVQPLPKAPPMKEFYFTFGSNHPCKKGWVVIEAEDEAVARHEMSEHFGLRWSMCYLEPPDAEFFPRGEIGRGKAGPAKHYEMKGT